ncbi:unnamed protein product [Taenia asiatica]|uniref:Ovule protein n=1 Tax=Taenia asiatica TaxID=60517 RepID=A0A0R3WAV3_TAEAS|nr:unnamed protein product [Taenia asiatica]
MYSRGKNIKEVMRRNEKKTRRLEHREEFTNKTRRSDGNMGSNSLKNYGDVEVFNATSTKLFSAILKDLQEEEKCKKRFTKKPKSSGHRTRKNPSSNHKISATKITYVITYMTGIEFMRRNCVQKTSLRTNAPTTAAPNNLRSRPSSLSRPNPLPRTQSHSHSQMQKIARNMSSCSFSNSSPQLRAKCKRTFDPSSPTCGHPHPQKKASIPKPAMRQAHKSLGLPPKSNSSKRGSKAPSVEIQNMHLKVRHAM